MRKGYHCARQIHYHIVFPVKYRKSLLDEEVVQIIRETTAGIVWDIKDILALLR
jgi:putative transposase